MKIPRSAPTVPDMMAELGTGPEIMIRILAQVREPTVNGRYVHWDKLRHLDAPPGLDHTRWWLGLKMSRLAQRRAIPLVDQAGRSFSFIIPDPLPECLHHADSGARGAIGAPEEILNRDVKDQYLIRSLIEESITSSQLEGASVTRDIAKRMLREGRPPRDRGERMILNNFETMQQIIQVKDRELTPGLIAELQKIATKETLDDPSGSGRLRRSDERIVVGDDTGEVFHTPPPAVQLEERMELMCGFANGATGAGFIHPMIRSMILHFWMAYDHPFIDGNGRTARALFYWSMLKQGYWLFEFLSISRIILKGPAKYGKAFLHSETDENDLTYFLLYHADIIRRAIDELHVYIERKSSQLRRAEAGLRGMSELNHRQRNLIFHALRHPGQRYTIESHRASHKTVYETARADLTNLAERGLLTKIKVGQAWNFFPAKDLEDKLR